MVDPKILHLVLLFEAGYTHAVLKEIFPKEEGFDPESLWISLSKGERRDELKEEKRKKILEKIPSIQTKAIEKILEEKKIEIVTIFDSRYPDTLRMIRHAPFFFYVRGNLRNISMIGVVGSRKHTHYSERILRKILPDVIESGMGIVSGGALGVDTLAHTLTLEKNGYPVAVFGTGIDRCYPAGNKKLFESIIELGGALISHFPLGTGPELYNFPIRNEIVAGMSKGILISEAGLGSGTLITAQLALEHGREVFAVPGDIDRATSEGVNMLIATGQAKCVRSAGDILEEYFDIKSIGSGMTPIIKISPVFSNEVEKIIYESIEGGHRTIDEILNITNLEMTDLMANIAMLEIGGHVTIDQMGKYQII